MVGLNVSISFCLREKKKKTLRISCQWVQIQHITKYHQQKNVAGSALVQSACTCVWKRYNEIML